MRITSREYLKVENFKPFKYIEIYRDGKKIYTVKTENTTETLMRFEGGIDAVLKFANTAEISPFNVKKESRGYA